MRIALAIEYDGRAYAGWQRQRTALSVQQVVEEGISKVANHSVEIVCAGRTDSHVHATHQVVHFDTNAAREPHSWVLGISTNTPQDVAVVWAKAVDDTFHARFSAQLRSYRYIILNRKIRPALNNQRVTWCYANLDETLMHTAAQALVGKHDFSSYRAQHCQSKTPIRVIKQLSVRRFGEYVVIDITANAFLYHMVRNIAGVLMTIGQGEQEVSWADDILQKRDRTQGGVTASPYGLYLTGVEYPAEYDLPEPQSLPIFA